MTTVRIVSTRMSLFDKSDGTTSFSLIVVGLALVNFIIYRIAFKPSVDLITQ